MYLLDTNALSEPIKKYPSSIFLQKLNMARGQRKFASAMSVLELRYGCARNPQGMTLWERIQNQVLSTIDILPIDNEVARRAGDLLASLQAKGISFSTEDLLIATTSLVYELVLVTHDAQFAQIPELQVEDWIK